MARTLIHFRIDNKYYKAVVDTFGDTVKRSDLDRIEAEYGVLLKFPQKTPFPYRVTAEGTTIAKDYRSNDNYVTKIWGYED